MITAYTHTYNAVIKRILIDCNILPVGSSPEGTQIHKALLDTGATSTCISLSLAKELELAEIDEASVTGANNMPFPAPVYCAKLILGRLVLPMLTVFGLPMDGTEYSAIIGMDVISQGDLMITNYDGKTVATFRTPSLESVDFVNELSMYNKCVSAHGINILHGISDKCACGSGKDYKNCHGKSIYNK